MSSSNSFNVTSSSSGVAAPAHGSSGTFERTSADTSGGSLGSSESWVRTSAASQDLDFGGSAVLVGPGGPPAIAGSGSRAAEASGGGSGPRATEATPVQENMLCDHNAGMVTAGHGDVRMQGVEAVAGGLASSIFNPLDATASFGTHGVPPLSGLANAQQAASGAAMFDLTVDD